MPPITDSTVRQARTLVDAGAAIATVARDLSVDLDELIAAVSGETFRHIEDPLPVEISRSDQQANAPATTTHRRAAGSARSKPTPMLHAERIREERWKLGLSQQGFAEAMKAAGWTLGIPNGCSKRLVQKWERGEHKSLSSAYQAAFKQLTGVDYVALSTPTSPPDSAKAARALEDCIVWVAEIGRDVTQFHRQLMDVYEYVAGEPAAALKATTQPL